MPDRIYSLSVASGIQRDGTQLAGRNWSDGQWTRMQRGLPQKIGGYHQVGSTNEIVRGTFLIPDQPNFNFYYGTASQLNYIVLDQNRLPIAGPINRTPATLQASASNDWQFDTMFSSVDEGGFLIAFAAPNLADIGSTINRPIYYGEAFSTTPLIPTGFQVSGGILSLHPILMMYGNDGFVAWTQENNPTVIANEARISSSKVCFALPVRGGNNSPAALFWTLDSVIRATNVGTQNIEFAFDTITSESSLLSSRGIIEYDGIYMWAATDRFLAYNGVIQEIPNDMNLNHFFQNINYAQRQKVWATKVTQFGEIWWFYPRGNATECTHAVVFNVREKTWYDTEIHRSDGYFDQTFTKPIWADNELHSGSYPLWVQEVGTDKLFSNLTSESIPSFITSPYLSYCTTAIDGNRNAMDKYTAIVRIEPDFIQTQNMNCIVSGKQYARSPIVAGAPKTFSSTEVKIDYTFQARELLITFSSDEIGGYYEMGQVLIVGRPGDSRP